MRNQICPLTDLFGTAGLHLVVQMDVSKTYNANAKDELKDNLYLTEQWPKEDVKYIFLPFGSFKTYWDLFTLTFVIYTAMVLPLSIFYYPDDMCIPAWMVRDRLSLELIGVSCRFCELLDLLLSPFFSHS